MSRRSGERLKRRLIPKRLDGTGHCWFQASSGTYDLLQIDGVPRPADSQDGEGGQILRNRFGPKRPGGCSTAYRVAFPEPEGWTANKPPTRHFVLSASHINETLFYLAEYWRQSGVVFVGVTNADGNLFKHVGLHGVNYNHLRYRIAG